jgi:hypothetical protein
MPTTDWKKIGERGNYNSLLVENKSNGVGEGVVFFHDGDRRRARIVQ